MKSLHSAALLLLFVVVGGAVWLGIVATGAFKPDPQVEIIPTGGTNGTLRVVTDADYWPYSFIDGNGRVSGREVELLYAIANQLGVNVDLRAMKWQDCLDLAARHGTDIVLTCAENPTGCEGDGLVSSLPLDSDDYTVFGKEKIRAVSELKGRRLAQLDYGNVNPTLRAAGFGREMRMYGSHRDAFQAIERGDADFTVIRYTPAMGLLKNLGITDIRPQCFAGRSFFCIGVDSANPDLLRRVNEAILVLRVNGEMARLSEKWLTTYVRSYTFGEAVATQPGGFFTLLFVAAALVVIMLLLGYQRLSISHKLLREQSAHRVHEQILSTLVKTYFGYNVTVDLETFKCSLDRGTGCEGMCALFERCASYDQVFREFESHIMHFQALRRVTELLASSALRKFAEEGRRGFIGSAEYPTLSENPGEENRIGWREVNLFINVDPDGRPVANIVGRNVTGQKRQQESEAKLKLAEAANRARSEFLFNVSHDVRTPLHAIMGLSDIALQNASDTENVVDCLGKIKKSGGLLFSILNGVLDVSRLETGKVKLVETPGDMMLTFFGVEETMRELAREKNIDLSFEFGEITDRYVNADFEKANRVFVNIISNALKYTKEGGRVRVRCEQIDRCLYQYTFTDNGIGMSPEFLGKLYDRFSREANTTMSGVAGMGLGLSIAKAFIDLMGGSIACQSKKGEGTTFTVTLPFRLQKGDPVYVDPVSGKLVKVGEVNEVKVKGEEMKVKGEGEEVAQPSHPSPLTSHPFAGKRVLIVDDCAMNRVVAQHYFKGFGFAMEIAEDGRAAVDAVTAHGPGYFDVIMMDIQMPVMDGLAATREIRRWEESVRRDSPSYRPIAIIAWSANAFEEDREKSRAAGMNDHLAKGIKVGQLQETLTRCL